MHVLQYVIEGDSEWTDDLLQDVHILEVSRPRKTLKFSIDRKYKLVSSIALISVSYSEQGIWSFARGVKYSILVRL